MCYLRLCVRARAPAREGVPPLAALVATGPRNTPLVRNEDPRCRSWCACPSPLPRFCPTVWSNKAHSMCVNWGYLLQVHVREFGILHPSVAANLTSALALASGRMSEGDTEGPQIQVCDAPILVSKMCLAHRGYRASSSRVPADCAGDVPSRVAKA